MSTRASCSAPGSASSTSGGCSSSTTWRACSGTPWDQRAAHRLRLPDADILALLLKRDIQHQVQAYSAEISYLPHFLSWVVVAGLITELLSRRGIYGYVVRLLDLDSTVLLTSQVWFIPILIVSDIWKEIGYGTIIYLATMSSINPELYEAAVGRRRQPVAARRQHHPARYPAGDRHPAGPADGEYPRRRLRSDIQPLQPVGLRIADIIDTYIYRVGLQGFEFEFGTAVGLTKNVIGWCWCLPSTGSYGDLPATVSGSGRWRCASRRATRPSTPPPPSCCAVLHHDPVSVHAARSRCR